MIRSNVYVDGFNLYYGAVKNTLYKWLDIAELCRQVLPGIGLNRIRYFTALVKASPADPQITQRQQFYIRALETIPNLTVHYGHFLQSVVAMRLECPPATGSPMVRVLKMEEKGSDVNIATYMLADAFRNDCDQLIAITNTGWRVQSTHSGHRQPKPSIESTTWAAAKSYAERRVAKICEIRSRNSIRRTAVACSTEPACLATSRCAGAHAQKALGW